MANKLNLLLSQIGINLFLALFFALFIAFTSLYSDLSLALLGTVASISLLLPCFAWFFDQKETPWWHPIHVFCVLLFYSYIGRFLSRYLSMTSGETGVSSGDIDWLNNKVLVSELLNVFLDAGISYFLGYLLIKTILKKNSLSTFLGFFNHNDDKLFLERKNHLIATIMVFSIAVGIFIRFFIISLGLYTGFTAVENAELLSTNFMTPLFILEDYTRFAYGISCVVLIKGINNRFPRSLAFYVAIAYIIEEVLFLLFFRASKTYLLLYSFFPIFYIIVTQPKKKIFRTFVLSILGGVIFYQVFVFTFDYIFAYRLNYVRTAGNTFQLSSVVLEVAEQSFQDTIEGKYKNSNLTKGANIEDRFDATHVLIRIRERMPSPVPFLYFEDFVAVPLAWIPRFILPFKPNVVTGRVMSYDVWQAGGVGITSFPIGEAYMQMGELGVLITMFLRPLFQMSVFHLCRLYLIFDELVFASLMVLIRTTFSVDSLFVSSVSGMIQLAVIAIPVILMVGKFKKSFGF